VTQRFTCRRCGHPSPLPATAEVSFQLNEAFYQFQLHHGQVVTLALAQLRREARRSFLYLTETALTDSASRTREIDAAALLDGQLVIVEAKSNKTVPKRDVDWYTWLARRTRASRLIFATGETAWDQVTRGRIVQAETSLSPSGVQVTSLTRQSLLGSPTPTELERFERWAEK
jgi:hypothetical protein